MNNLEKAAIFETELAPFFTEKAPAQLPENFKNGFVKWFPWVNLVLVVLTIPAVLILLAALGLVTTAGAVGGGGGLRELIGISIALIAIVFRILATPGLFKATRGSWVLVYYAELVSVVSSVISLSIFGLAFNALFLFILFQVRPLYLK